MYIAHGGEQAFWIRVGALSAGLILPVLVYEYFTAGHRPDMALTLVTVLTYLVYKLLHSVAAIQGTARSLCF